MFKDENLFEIIRNGVNTAQFVSFSPSGELRFYAVRGFVRGSSPALIKVLVSQLISQSNNGFVDIRTFRRERSDGNPFVPKIGDASRITTMVKKFCRKGYYVIVGEHIPIKRCGRFGGVLWGDLLQGAPNATPRCVDDYTLPLPVLSLPRRVGIQLLERVYGCTLRFNYPITDRVEFSVHKEPVGYYYKHLIIWQVDRRPASEARRSQPPSWPNMMSMVMGDKVFGLLMAEMHGLRVPETTVIGRVFPQFSFGTPTKSDEPVWMRTAPWRKEPGKYPTRRGWEDPFRLMHKADPKGKKIAALLIQEGVLAAHSGALITDASGAMVVEGKVGAGDTFMVGQSEPEKLPPRVMRAVAEFYRRAHRTFGDVRAEWVFDGSKVWCLQLNLGRSASLGGTVYPGEPKMWKKFRVVHGLENLRQFATQARQEGFGITLCGNVGVTGHFAEVLCEFKVPSRIEHKIAAG